MVANKKSRQEIRAGHSIFKGHGARFKAGLRKPAGLERQPCIVPKSTLNKHYAIINQPSQTQPW